MAFNEVASNADASECIVCHQSNSIVGQCSEALKPPPPPMGLNTRSPKMLNDSEINNNRDAAALASADTTAKNQSLQQGQRNYIRTLLEDSGDESLTPESEALWEWCDSIL